MREHQQTIEELLLLAHKIAKENQRTFLTYLLDMALLENASVVKNVMDPEKRRA